MERARRPRAAPRGRRARRAGAMPHNVVVSFDVGTRNFAYCVVRRAPFAVLSWEVIDTYEGGGASSKSNIEGKKRALLRCLHRRAGATVAHLGAGDAVVIEQQPFGRGHGSPTMNILAHVIGTYFLLAAETPCEPAYDVRQVAAKTKLGIAAEAWGGARVEPPPRAPRRAASVAAPEPAPQPDAEPEAAPEPAPGAEQAAAPEPAPEPLAKRRRREEYVQYKKNKGHSVMLCESILHAREELAPWRDMFERSGKKDDLADAFTQALSQLVP